MKKSITFNELKKLIKENQYGELFDRYDHNAVQAQLDEFFYAYQYDDPANWKNATVDEFVDWAYGYWDNIPKEEHSYVIRTFKNALRKERKDLLW